MNSEKTEIVRRRSSGELAKVAASWALPALGIAYLLARLIALILK